MEKIVPSVVLVGVMCDLQLEGIRLRLKVILLEVSMKNYRTVAIVWVLACLLVIPARAEVIPGRWEKLAALAIETLITVDLKSGDRSRDWIRDPSCPRGRLGKRRGVCRIWMGSFSSWGGNWSLGCLHRRCSHHGGGRAVPSPLTLYCREEE